MALQKQNYFLSITDGLDTKTDSKNVIPTRFLELENLIFTKTGSVSKRLGYRALTKNILSGTELDSGSAVTTYDGELLAYSSNNFYSFSESEDKWVEKGAADIGLASSQAVSSTGDVYFYPFFAKLDNLSCYVYDSTSVVSSGVEYKIVDDVTGSVISTGTVATATKPRVQRLENYFIISYILSGNLYYIAVNSADPSQVTAQTSVITAVDSYDMKLIGNRIFFLVCKSSSGGTQLLFLSSGFSFSSPIAIEASGTQTKPDLSVSGINSVRVCYINSTPAVKTIIYTYDLTISSGSATISGEYPFAVSAVDKGGSANLYITYKYDSGTSSENVVKQVNVTDAGVAGSPTTLFYQVMAQTKAVEFDGTDYFVICKDESESTQRTVRTYFLVNSNGRIISKFDEENSVVLNRSGALAYLAPLIVNGEKLQFAGLALAEFQSEPATAAGGLVTATVLKLHTTDFTPTANYFDTKLGGNLHVVGGILKAYDGSEICEHGFLEIPRAPTEVSVSSNGPTPGLGLSSSTSSYQYMVVYAWRDNQGQLHRSCPSPALTVSVPQATVNYSEVVINVPTLTLTNKDKVEIEIFRTLANGTIFYKVLEGGTGAFSTRVFNDTTAPYIAFTDNISDATIESNEAIYTTGGVLENIAAPASRYAVTYKNRVMLLSADGKTLHYSKLREANGPVEFNDSLAINLDEFGGPATALAVMDDHVIIFKQRALFALTGEGPNNLGQQDDFRQPYLISSDAGCIEPNSVVRTPDSIMFKSDKGIYELARNFQVGYIGAPVEAYNANTVSSANLLETTNEIRFTTTEGRTLVYDYFHKRWTTFTNMLAVDAVSYNNQYVYIREDGTVLKETEGYYYDQGSYIKTKLVSAWISLAGIQGFERVYQLELLGTYKASHKLKVSMAYDFVNAYLHDTIINPTSVLNPSYYGDGTYGSDTPYGGDGLLYQFRIFPKIQKCQAFKICIEDYPGTESGGEAYTLSNIAATVGIKSGLNRVPASRSFGVS